MGSIILKAIIVTSDSDNLNIEAAKQVAEKIGLQTTDIKDSRTNGYQSFLVIPDGSKIGWDTHNTYCEMRDQFKEWLTDNLIGHWVEVFYGPDIETPRITNYN